MSEIRNQITFYYSFLTSIRCIQDPAERALAYDTILDYGFREIVPDLESLSPMVQMAFHFSQPVLDAARRKAEAGKLGGMSKKAKESVLSSASSKGEEESKEENKKENKIETEKKNKNENKIENKTEGNFSKELPLRGQEEPPTEAFLQFWRAYPNGRGGKIGAWNAWRECIRCPEQEQQLMLGLEAYARSADWKKEEGRYVPAPERFIRSYAWEKPPAVPQPPTGAEGRLGAAELESIRYVLANC